eukprot:XP_019073272.1 PREDICTED: putative disease resistance RPP13-like protein 1 [Vitis vinifera]
MAFVGEAFLSASIQKLVDMLACPDLRKFAREEQVHAELKKWEGILLKIHAVLHDAEEKQMTNRFVQIWLAELRDLAYDVEDILDDFATEALRRKLITDDPQPSTSTVRSIISSLSSRFNPNALVYNLNMGSKLEEITARLHEISTQKGDLDLRENVEERSNRKRKRVPETTSLVVESRVYGRETDKEAILEVLLRDESIHDNEVCVIPIVGMGGVGKTTLAQLAYHDDRVKNHFDLRAWVCVSDDFDVLRITKTLLQSIASYAREINDLNLLQVKLKEKLSGKKFLLVLDDVWNENYDKWDRLCTPLRAGGPGSKVIITTRNMGVASLTRTVSPYPLQELSNDDCRAVFAQHALGARNFEAHPHVKIIGEEMVNRCRGLPLVAKALGGILRNELNHEAWDDILKSKIWDLPEEKSGVLPALKLSYHHLPSHLKQCFAYCAIFPKGYEFKKDELILLWMGEGFLQTKGKKRMEDLGSKYFSELLSRSFFQQSSDVMPRFMMHDLIHDLAQSIAGNVSFNLEDKLENNENIFQKARHLSFIRQANEIFKKFEVVDKGKYLRTFLALPISVSFMKSLSFITTKVTHDLLMEMKCLRVLSLSVGNLINLRHLDIAGTSQLEEMPPRMGCLTNLQTLSKFIVGKGNGSSIQELKHLLDLQGELSIQGLHNVRNTRDAVDACLKNKCHIEELTMGWSGDFDDSRNELNEMLVLELLQPQRNLKKLTVEFYGGPKFPSWIGNPSFSKMESLTLKNCGKCTSLPCLGRLSLLKALRIQGMCKVKTIGDEFFGEVSLFKPFPCLESLRFEDMPEWEDWCFSDMVEECEGLFSCLRELRIRECPKLTGSLPNCLPSLAELEIFECPKLKAALPRLAYVCSLNVVECNEVVLRNGVDLSSLTTLNIQRISRLTCLREGFTQLLAALQKLVIRGCGEMTSLWENRFGLECLRGLESIDIWQCHGLESLEEQRLPCNLKHLKIENCANLQRLPNGLQSLTCLEELSLQSCPKLESFPEMGLPPMLRSLVLQKCNTLKLLPHNYNSGFLEYLEIEHCPCLISFPEGELPASLKQLKIKDCANLQTLPEGMMHHNSMVSNNSCCLEVLEIRKCSSLPSLPTGELPSTLKRLEIWDCRQFQPISEKMLHSNTALEHLSISNYPNMKILPGFLHSLTYLYMYGCQGLVSFPERGLPTPNLRDLYINNCENLKSLPHQMQNLLSLQELNIRNCQGLESFPECGLAPNLTSLSIRDCVNLKVPLSEWGLHRLTSLSSLYISGVCPSLASLSDDDCLLPSTLSKLFISKLDSLACLALKNLSSLERISIYRCPKLRSIGLPETLSRLEIRDC